MNRSQRPKVMNRNPSPFRTSSPQPTEVGAENSDANTPLCEKCHVNRRRSRRRRGALTVEFALTVPILFFFFFASVEFGRMHMIRHSLQNAVYEGARTALVPNTSDEAVRVATRSVLNASGVSTVQIVVDQREDQVTIAAQVPFDTESWGVPLFFTGRFLSSSITLTRDAG
jgi:hypothetical protein